MPIKAAWQTKHSEKRVQCELCPHNCLLSVGQVGLCKVRKNSDGELVSTVFGLPVALHLDPIEKKPLFHFHPGSKVLSLGTVGCNFSCQFCQNSEISQLSSDEVNPPFHSPESVIESARRVNADGIAFTYNEPTVFYEYMLAIAKLAKKSELKTVLVSNGYINEAPLKELAHYIDAANIDVKAFSDDFYRKIAGGTLSPVLQSLKLLKRMGVHIEVTNLIIPELNDSPEELKQLFEWIAEHLGKDTPLHLSRFFPRYKMVDVAVTPIETLEMAQKVAKESGLEWVYLGNV